MDSRMNKYEFETPEPAKRTEKNADLYLKETFEDYSDIDLNSNISVLKTDARSIDVDKIREMLDKKYRDNIPKRKSIDIELDEEEEVPSIKVETKEYDLNEILSRAKNSQTPDYQKERLKKIRDTNYDILDKLDLGKEKEEPSSDRAETEKELLDLINTINQFETKIKHEYTKDDTLLNLTDATSEDKLKPALENSFYTGDLAVKQDDFDDFDDIQEDIKTNSVLIGVLIIIFIIIVLAVAVFLLNKYLNWGLF